MAADPDLAAKVDAFCVASIRDWTGRAARLLAENPEIEGYSFATAVLLGDAARVGEELQRDPSLATRADERTGWTALHLACASRWHQLDPARADGLVEVARLLLDAGADVTTRIGQWTPLRCAVGSASTGAGNEPIVDLLIERGARPEDHDLYLAGFAANAPGVLRLLVQAVPDMRATAEQALAAPVSKDDAESVRILLEAGADPNRYRDDDGDRSSALCEAIEASCSANLVELLLEHGADANAGEGDGRSPYRLALTHGRSDVADLLRRRGAGDDASDADRFLAACLQPARDEVERRLADDPALVEQVTRDEPAAIVRAAASGNTDAVALMLDLGFARDAHAGDDGATPLHAAAYAGSADAVRLLLDRGAQIEARDTTWESTPLGWAVVGSGERPRDNPRADWPETVRILLDAGAAMDDITLSPDDPKQPSAEVAEILRARGI
jgi:ankyrin repeat protein